MQQLALQLPEARAGGHHPDPSSRPVTLTGKAYPPSELATGEKAKARDIIAAIRTLKRIEEQHRPASDIEREILARFGGFGPVALSIFPDPIRGTYKDGWQEMGEELRSLLTDQEYDSAKRTTFNAFYTSPTVIEAMHTGLCALGVAKNAIVLEPGAGIGRFIRPDYHFIGVELDSISGRIAKAIHPGQDIRIENFRDSKLPPLDAVIGNVPFANIPFPHNGQKFALHDGFIAKSVDALKPGGVLALVTSHFTLDKQNAAIREYLAERADFLGAIRLPSDAFKREGTQVVTDIVFLRKRAAGEEPHHADPDWLGVAPLTVEGAEVSVNKYFLNHPKMVLGTWTLESRLYGDDSYGLTSNGNLAEQLREAVGRLPGVRRTENTTSAQEMAPARTAPFVPPPPLPHLTEGSFFVGDDRSICRIENGEGVPVVYGGKKLTAYGSKVGKRMEGEIKMLIHARRVLQSQNEGWPEKDRKEARRELNNAYDRFTAAYGPINLTTFGETKDGTVIRRMPNLTLFREDPDAMLVMSLEEYDETTGNATKAAIMKKDVVGQTPTITHVKTAEEGLLVSLNQRGAVDLPYIASLYGKPEQQIIAELGDLIYRDPESKTWQTADAYLSGNVRSKLAAAEAAGSEYVGNADALRKVQPEDVLPGDIDANLGAPWIPESDIQAFAASLFGVEAETIQVAHVKKDALWSVEAGYAAEQSVAAKSEYGTARANGTGLLELALNMKSPTVYDPDPIDSERRIVNQEETLAAREKQKIIKEKFKQWVFTDPDRTERLVRLYNDNFNNLRPRLFDGSHLDFPGMNQAITLNPHQKAAVWRVMSGGNTLLAHCVGAGKSFEMAAAAMKLRQAGLAQKPVITVPNHLLEQFAREFQTLYPNAKLLIATKDDLARDRRKLLTAKIASGDWDAIILTHSSFERIGMSREYQEKFLNEQIAEYDQLLLDNASKGTARSHRNIIKTLEKQKAAREEKLTDLMAEDKKDDGLVFDQIGVDMLMVDECFTYDTLVETDGGPLKIGDIVTQKLGVNVKTLNTSTKMVEWKPVVNWFANRRRTKLVEVAHEKGSIRCTPSHKLFTEQFAYRKAGQIAAGEALLILQEAVSSNEQMPGQEVAEVLLSKVPGQEQDYHDDLRVVQPGVFLPHARSGESCKEAASVLQRQLQDACAACEPGFPSALAKVDEADVGKLTLQRASQPQTGRSHEGQASVIGNTSEALAHYESVKPQAADSRRQRTIIRSPVTIGQDYRYANRVLNKNEDDSALDGQPAQELQGGFGRSGSQTRGGSGREQSPSATGARAGCQEGQGPIPSRVVSVTILEPGSDGEYQFGGRTHQIVYDIEVADNHNYFANGILVSNCQAYKNLETPTKMDRVAGIQTGGSERAFDLFMKGRYLDQRHPGHGLVGASGTPISNSMVEMYTMQKYFDPAGLNSRGIDHFDAWAANFGEVVDTMEISPDGKTLKPRSRFAKFVNLPELQMMFRSFADVQTPDMLNLPRPRLKGGKPIIVACPMSDEQHVIQDQLVERYERLRSQKVDPRVDNALNITTDGRKLALDARMLSPEAPDFPGSKINSLAENVIRIWNETADRRGTQMIFCDMGVHPTPWGYSAYDDVIGKLIAGGIPQNQIAVMGDADTDAKKRALFDQVRAGQVRVLIGSTQKMGTGTNVQKRLVALHHLDAPWKPAEVEQREGRILRQGNENEEVAIYRYVTEQSFDSYMWQALETKARFINQIMRGDAVGRQAEDIGGQELDYATVKSIASGNPAFMTLAEADAEIKRLSILSKSHADQQYLARRNLRELPERIERLTRRVEGLAADQDTMKGNDDIVIGRETADPVAALGRALDTLPQHVMQERRFPLGTYRGLRFGMVLHPSWRPEIYLEGAVTRLDRLGDSQGPRAVFNCVERLARGYVAEAQRTREDLAVAERQLHDYQTRVGKPFEHEAYLQELAALRDKLKAGLAGAEPKEDEPTVADLAEKIKALRAANTVEAAPERTAPRKASAEEPVTTRILRKENAADPTAIVTAEEISNPTPEKGTRAGGA